MMMRGGSRRSRRRRTKNSMSDETSRKLGIANLDYAQGRLREAAALLTEVVKEAPNQPAPYHTLALIYEAMGRTRKALDFFMIAAHLTPRDTDLWRRLADLSSELGFMRQAVYCLTKVVHRRKDDHSSRYDRAVLLAELNEPRRALLEFEELSNKSFPEEAEVPKMRARLHHRMKAPQQAIAVLEVFLLSHREKTDLTHINILAELYMEQGSYTATVELIERARDQANGEPLPLDLEVKAGLALVHLGRTEEGKEHLAPLLAADQEQYSDLLQSAATALSGSNRPVEAVPYLQWLNAHPTFSVPSTWAALAAALRAAGRAPEAVTLYEAKLATVPLESTCYLEVALTMTELWREVGEMARAREFLGHLDILLENHGVGMPEDSSDQMKLFLHKNRLHLLTGAREDFVRRMLPVVEDTLDRLEGDAEAAGDPNMTKLLRRALNKRRVRTLHGRPAGAGSETEGETDSVFQGYKVRDRRKAHVQEADREAERLAREMEGGEASDGGAGDGLRDNGLARTLFMDDGAFDTLVKLVEAMVGEGRVGEAKALLTRAVEVANKQSRWLDKGKRDLMKVLLVDLHTACGELKTAMQHLKYVCTRWPCSLRVWNQYSRIYCQLGSVKQWVKYISTLRARHPTSLPLMILQGHVAALSREYPRALSEYYHAYRHWPGEPLVLLSIAVMYVCLAMGKRVADRNRAVLQAFAFLGEYHHARNNPQESFYNMGRAAHQLGLMNIALAFYRRALDSPPPGAPASPAAEGPDSEVEGPPPVDPANLDLTREIAHNLVLLYRASGSPELAREVVLRYLVV